MKRTSFADLEWRDKLATECDRSELLELCEMLHSMVWDSAENFEAVHSFNQELIERHGGRA